MFGMSKIVTGGHLAEDKFLNSDHPCLDNRYFNLRSTKDTVGVLLSCRSRNCHAFTSIWATLYRQIKRRDNNYGSSC